jgi:hypothetical protein
MTTTPAAMLTKSRWVKKKKVNGFTTPLHTVEQGKSKGENKMLIEEQLKEIRERK